MESAIAMAAADGVVEGNLENSFALRAMTGSWLTRSSSSVPRTMPSTTSIT